MPHATLNRPVRRLNLIRLFEFVALAFMPSNALHAEIVLKVGDVQVQRTTLPDRVLVPILAISDDPSLKLSGFNLNFDIGGDGQAPLGAGIELPAALPDDKRIIATGGESNVRNWFMMTVNAANGGLIASDILINGNSPELATDYSIYGNPNALTGGKILFNLALNLKPTVADKVLITMPSELGALPFMTDQYGNGLVVNYLPGSITVLSSVPEPGSMMVLSTIASCAFVLRVRVLRARSS
ncbi:MAG: hypothetical protein FJ308_14890 [Planctomycetes bacterium]|nr:hypothetical protein [Planctomycetota bacterium]